MQRRYTIHQDGDILMEELDASGAPIDPEPAPESERLPFAVLVTAPEGELAKAKLVELLEAVINIESDDAEWTLPAGKRRAKLPLA